REPLGDALERIGAGGRIGADMRFSRAISRVDEAAPLAHRVVWAVELVIGAGIDHERGACAAPARAGDHLLAGGSRGPVIGAADQDQGRDARAPRGFAEAPAARIERDRRAEVGGAVARRRAGLDRPQRGDRAIGPAQERYVLLDGPGLTFEPAT